MAGILQRIRNGLTRGWQAVAPGKKAWKGAAWGVVLAVVLLTLWIIYYTLAVPEPNGYGLVTMAVLLSGSALVSALLVLAVNLLARVPALYRWAVVLLMPFVLFTFGSLGMPGQAQLDLFFIIPFSLAGAGLWSVLRGYKRSTPLRRAVAIAGLVVGVAAIVLLGWWLFTPGFRDTTLHLSTAGLLWSPDTVPAEPLKLPDPSEPGSYFTKTLTYGSGTDRHRPEFGSDAALTTTPVDASPLLPSWKGLPGVFRTAYWGFDTTKLPLNGRVWYPMGDGPFPIALIVHGNHMMEDYSDTGYGYMAELLASHGFIAVSVDENFLNTSLGDMVTGPDGGLSGEYNVRGWLLLEHLRTWREWNQTAGNPFYGKVDLERVALIGHSRGGNAVAVAAAFNRLSHAPEDGSVVFDYGFGIRSVVAIAPVDRYRPAGWGTELENVSYLALHGSNDGDARSFEAACQYERVHFTPGDPGFKALVYIPGANHGQYNTSWGRNDQPEPTARLLNLAPIMSAEEQEQTTKVFITAFLEATLHDKWGYIPLFRNARTGIDWLETDFYLQQYADGNEQLVSTFDEDIDLATASLPGSTIAAQNLTVWRENRVTVKWGTKDTNGAFLGWDAETKPAPAYRITLPDGLALDGQSTLFFSLADADENPKGGHTPSREPIDLTVEVIDVAGHSARLPLSHFSLLARRTPTAILKIGISDNVALSEAIFQRFEFPMSAFTAVNPDFDPAALREVALIFDKTEAGVVILDNVGFRGDR